MSRPFPEMVIRHAYFDHAVEVIQQAMRYAQSGAPAKSIPLYGPAGVGKTWVVNAICQEFPVKRTPDGISAPVIRIKNPFNPSVKQIARFILKALGDPNAHKGTEIDLYDRADELLKAAGTVVLLIDEFQHLVDRSTSRFQEEAANALKTLAEDRNLVLVASGLPRGNQVIGRLQQLQTRFMSPAIMPRLDWRFPFAQRQFLGILNSFAEELDEPSLRDEGIAFRLYAATGGLLRNLGHILRYADLMASESKRKSSIVTPKILGESYARSIYKHDAVVERPFDPKVKVEPNDELLARIARSMVDQDDPYSDLDEEGDDLHKAIRRALMGDFPQSGGVKA